MAVRKVPETTGFEWRAARHREAVTAVKTPRSPRLLPRPGLRFLDLVSIDTTFDSVRVGPEPATACERRRSRPSMAASSMPCSTSSARIDNRYMVVKSPGKDA